MGCDTGNGENPRTTEGVTTHQRKQTERCPETRPVRLASKRTDERGSGGNSSRDTHNCLNLLITKLCSHIVLKTLFSTFSRLGVTGSTL